MERIKGAYIDRKVEQINAIIEPDKLHWFGQYGYKTLDLNNQTVITGCTKREIYDAVKTALDILECYIKNLNE
jgi:ribonucleotide reductase beta subunit family protein with ferritin-like domain